MAGASRIYVLNQRGKVVRVIKNLTSITGVAVGRDGVIYATSVLQGGILRIDRKGNKTVAEVTEPLGITLKDGCLYSTANSVGFTDPTVPGKVVRVGHRAFQPLA